MEFLFTTLSRAIEATPAIALSGAFAWGVLSVLLSPCHLASIPLVVGFIDRQGRVSARRAATLAIIFASGILITIAILGVATAAAGRMLGDLGGWINYAVAPIFLAVGLHFLDVLPLPGLTPRRMTGNQTGPLAALLLGLLFGAALGPCTFAFMAPMLGVAFRVAATQAVYGAVLLLFFGLGHCAVIALAGASVGWVQRYLNWNSRSASTVWLRRVCGVLVIAAGIYMLIIA